MTISIGGVRVKPNEQQCIMIPLPNLYHSEPVLMPTHVICGSKTGPSLLVTAAIHGDEINGIEIIRRLLQFKTLRAMRGNLILVPVVNVYGYLYQSRYLMDRRDLNRSFPGSSSGSIAARLAKVLVTELIAHATHLIDLHTGALHRDNLPQIRASLHDPETLRLAKAFSAPVIIDSRQRDGSLRQMAADLKKPLLLYEAGEALRFDETSIRLGVKGILNTMRALKMLDVATIKNTKAPSVVASTHWVRAEVSGNLQSNKKLGAHVTKGEVIGTISNPFDLSVREIRSPYKGIIIGLCKLPPVHEGQALFHIALLEQGEDLSEQTHLDDYLPEDAATFFPERF
jgi:predicted deacylase